MTKKERLFKHAEATIEDAVRSLALNDAKYNKIKKDLELDMKVELAERIEDFAEVFMNAGYDRQTQAYKTMKEINDEMEETATFLRDFSGQALGFVVAQTITRLVSKVIKPELEAWMFVSQELVMPEGHVVYTTIIGDGHGAHRVGEAAEYNSFTLDSTEDYIKTTGKVGIKASFSEEAQKRAGAAAIKVLVEAAVADLKRFKSVEAIKMLETHARNYFDGLLSSNIDIEKYKAAMGYGEEVKATTGIGLLKASGAVGTPDNGDADHLAKDGSLTIHDIGMMIADCQARGYDIDTIMINPLSYGIFTMNPQIKTYFKETANTLFLIPKRGRTIAKNMIERVKRGAEPTTLVGAQIENAGTGANIPSTLLGGRQFTIIVTPIVTHVPVKGIVTVPKTRFIGAKPALVNGTPVSPKLYPMGDILFVDSTRALTYVHDGSGVQSDRIDDRLRDVTDIKFKEYYSFIMDKNPGVFAARNITISPWSIDSNEMRLDIADVLDGFDNKTNLV